MKSAYWRFVGVLTSLAATLLVFYYLTNIKLFQQIYIYASISVCPFPIQVDLCIEIYFKFLSNVVFFLLHCKTVYLFNNSLRLRIHSWYFCAFQISWLLHIFLISSYCWIHVLLSDMNFVWCAPVSEVHFILLLLKLWLCLSANLKHNFSYNSIFIPFEISFREKVI